MLDVTHTYGPLIHYGLTGADRALAKRIMHRMQAISQVMINTAADDDE